MKKDRHVSYWKRIAKLLILLLSVVFFFELLLRIFHGGNLPLVPYVIENGAPHLPFDDKFYVRFRGHKSTEYITDKLGCRVGYAKSNQNSIPGVLSYGDSQVLGYGIPFGETFTSLLSKKLYSTDSGAAIIASPGLDVENGISLFKSIHLEQLQKSKILIYSLNLENDLDEIYFRGQSNSIYDSPPLKNWLIRNSFLYCDWLIVDQNYISPHKNPPGINAITYGLLPDERIYLAELVADKICELLKRPFYTKTVCIIIPTQIQLSEKLFTRFKNFYSPTAYETWKQRVVGAAEMMTAVGNYITIILNKKGVPVINLRDIFLNTDVSRIFQPLNYHLSEYGHQVIYDTLYKYFAKYEHHD
jgi:hypothetical protein